MKYYFICFSLGVLFFGACNQGSVQQTKDGLIARVREGEARWIRLQALTDDVIRVTASPEGRFAEGVNLIEDTKDLPAPAFTVSRSGDTVTLRTAATQASLLLQTGEIWFADTEGNLILREKEGGGKEFQALEVEGTKGYSLRQVFEDPGDEALYGLGQHQSDEFNYKGRNEELFQYNTKVSIPFVLSTKGYGVLWHNYSLSRFGDKRPYANLGDVFILRNAQGEDGGLTATYYEGPVAGSAPGAQRSEEAIDYEDLTSIRNFPPRFPKNQASAVWE